MEYAHDSYVHHAVHITKLIYHAYLLNIGARMHGVSMLGVGVVPPRPQPTYA